MDAGQTQREVVMKLSAKADGNLGEPYRQLARSAKDAAKQEADLHKQLGQRNTVYETLAKSKKTLATAGGKEEYSEEQKYQQLLKQRIKDYETAKRLKADLVKFGAVENERERHGLSGMLAGGRQMLGSPGVAAGLGELALAMKIGDVIGQQIALRIPGQRLSEYNQLPGAYGLNQNRVEERQFEADTSLLRMGGNLASLVGLGGIGDAVNTFVESERVNQPFVQRQNNLEQVRRATEFQRQREERQTVFAQRRMALEREQTQFQALARHGMSSAPQQTQASLAAQQQLTGLHQRLQQGAPYQREQAESDVAAAISARLALQRNDIESQRRLSILREQGQAGVKQETTARQQVTAAQARVKQADARLAGLQGHGATDEQMMEARLQKEQALVGVAEARKRLDDAMLANRQNAIQLAETLNQKEQSHLAILEQEAARLQHIIREEQSRETGRREAFGLMHPMQQHRALKIAEKLERGQKLTYREQEVARSMPDLFDQRLRKIALEKTGEGSIYQQVRQKLPELGERQRQAERAAVQITNNIPVQINLNEKAVADQINKVIMKAIAEAMEQTRRQAEDSRNRLANQQRMQTNAAMGH